MLSADKSTGRSHAPLFQRGSIIGDFHEASTEVGISKRLELNYTHEYDGLEIYNGIVIVS